MGEPELLDLEYAALLHDLGQLSLADPLPGGATVTAAPAVVAEVASRGAEVVRQTGVLDRVARVVEAQATPYADGAGRTAAESGRDGYGSHSSHGGHGGKGNSARALDVAGHKMLLAWKGAWALAMGATCGFSRVSCGFVGSSDGWRDLSEDFRMDWEFGSATNGNVALMGELNLCHCSTPAVREFVLAIGFGEGLHACPGATLASTIALGGLEQLLACGLQPAAVATTVTYRPAANVRIALFTPHPD